MAHRILSERTKRIEALARGNEGWIDSLQNRVEELEMCKEICEEKICKQDRAIRELEGTVRVLESAVRTITSPASAVVPEEQVTPMHAVKRRRDPSHTPVTTGDLFSDATESVTPISEVVNKKDEDSVDDIGNHKRARNAYGQAFVLTFDETATQKPPSMDGPHSEL